MKVNPLLNEIAKGQWAMSIESLNFWGSIAHQILNGTFSDKMPTVEANGLIRFVHNGTTLRPDENGAINTPKGTVAIVNMIGVLIKYGDWCTYGSDEIVSALYAAERNPNVIGTVLYSDGPGGSVSAIAPFLEFGKMRKKPLVALYDGCCSAHLYSMYGTRPDYVMAENDISATIGSIGVVISFADNRKYLSEKGFELHEIYADESSDKNLAFKLALEGKYEKIKEEMLNPLARKFQNDVMLFRPNLKKEVPGVLTGKTFFTDEALEIGFTDGVGSMQKAIDMVQMLSEMKSL